MSDTELAMEMLKKMVDLMNEYATRGVTVGQANKALASLGVWMNYNAAQELDRGVANFLLAIEECTDYIVDNEMPPDAPRSRRIRLN